MPAAAGHACRNRYVARDRLAQHSDRRHGADNGYKFDDVELTRRLHHHRVADGSVDGARLPQIATQQDSPCQFKKMIGNAVHVSIMGLAMFELLATIGGGNTTLGA